ncbi:hypothetical protein [Brevundimonas sp.]|uniref:hypothetical protein n=1 Tax=Brevundimonas sp. TaxID=1871086 RepID=UPI003BAD5F48
MVDPIPQQAVVDDRHLGVDDDPVALLGQRREGEEAVEPVRLLQPIQHLRARRIHRQAVEPAGALGRGDDDDLRPIRLGQTLRQGGGDHRRGEILVLQINQPLGASDRVQMQGLAFAHLMPAGPFGFGPGDADGDVRHLDRHAVGPGIAIDLIGNGAFPGRLEPAFARQIAQRPRRRAVHHAHHLVTRLADDAAGQCTTRIAIQMLVGIPAVGRDVAPTAEGQLVVDHHHLLMMAGADGAGRIQPELHHPLAKPALGAMGIETLRRRDQQRRLPDQQPHIQIGLLLDQHSQLATDLGALVARPRLGIQMGARIELPAQKDDGPFRLLKGRGQGVEIGLVLHQHGKPMGDGRGPQTRPRLQQTAVVTVAALPHATPLPDSRDTVSERPGPPFHALGVGSISEGSGP